MSLPDILLPMAFFAIAFIYASVGFGGGSSYLAVLALTTIPFQDIRLTAMICNLIVVTGNTAIFSKSEYWQFKKYLPFLVVGTPLAFLGATIPLRQREFFILLGIALILAALLLWFQPEKTKDESTEARPTPLRNGLIGGAIGFFSGLVGIGGGIFLSPVLHFLRWDHARQIAATASLFILANSAAGLTGQLLTKSWSPDWWQIGTLAAAVLLGGQTGVRFSVKWFSLTQIRRITAALVFFAGIEILTKQLL